MNYALRDALNSSLSERCYSHSAALHAHCRAVALCVWPHNCACASKLSPRFMRHPRTARRYAQIKVFCNLSPNAVLTQDMHHSGGYDPRVELYKV